MKPAILLILLAFSFGARSHSEPQTVPFRLERGYLIVVSCSVGSLANLTCIVDTGATETVVDKRIANRLSLAARPDRATFLTQEVAVSAVSIPSLQLGPLRIENLPGLATDLSSLTPQLGIRSDKTSHTKRTGTTTANGINSD